MDPNTLDHEDGIDTFNCERQFMVRPLKQQLLGGAPAMAMLQMHKDKNSFTLQVTVHPPLPSFE